MDLPRTFREIHVSFVEYVTLVGKRWWAIVVSVAGGVLGLIAIAVPSHKVGQPLIPTWLWLTLLFGGIAVAQFLAFHEVRKDRDAARAEVTTRFDQVKFRFQLVRVEARFLKHILWAGETHEGCDFKLVFLNGGIDVLEYVLEKVSIQLGGKGFSHDPRVPSAPALILPGREHTFLCPHVVVPVPIPNVIPEHDALLGTGEYTAWYAHPEGANRFRVHQQFKIGWNFDPASAYYESFWATDGPVTHELVAWRR